MNHKNRNPRQNIKVALEHLGCPKNLIDSENLLGRLGLDGFLISLDPQDADVVLINTCDFIDKARDESIEAIKKFVKLKENGVLKAVIVTGCLAQREGQEISSMFPEIDAFVGFSHYTSIGKIIQKILRNKFPQKTLSSTFDFLPNDDIRLRVTPPHYAYLRISEGCNNCCSYCAIPQIRGPMRSKPISQVIDEAKILAGDGAQEIVVIAQDTTSYGFDIAGKSLLPELLLGLADIQAVHWIRLMYTHPASFSPELINVIASTPKVVHYLDIPVQHANTVILEKMRRRISKEKILSLISDLREKIPGLAIRTTVIVGFPGEGEDEFSELLSFLRDVRFERLGAFMYSSEKGTDAAGAQGQVPQDIKEKRFDEVMKLQQEIAFDSARRMVGRKIEVVIEQQISKTKWIARSYADAPEIDPVVYVEGTGLISGIFTEVDVVKAKGYDIEAKLVR